MASDNSDEDALAVFLMVTALEKSKKSQKKTKAMHMGPAVVTKYILYTDVNTTLFVNITWRPMRPLDFSHVTPSFLDGIEL